MSSLTYKRLNIEYRKLLSSDLPNIIAVPNPANLLECHFLIYNLENSCYDNGVYYGKLKLSPKYPFEPAKLYFITPNGRFALNKEICLSFTNFHPESWSTCWGIEQMLIAVVSFMVTEDHTHGSLHTSHAERILLA